MIRLTKYEGDIFMKGFKHFGVMLDCSRNGVLKVEEVKSFAKTIKKMGYDTVLLYTEETYEIKEEPYFGYMRGRYTQSELKEIDAYLTSIGMELVPCIQTLAHFPCLAALPHYGSYFDINDILLIDDDKTYDLIEKIFKTLSETFTSRTVNIGMDEAHMVGLGKYLDKHGYKNRTEILIKHLNRVCEIAKKYGFNPTMWSDMFFRLANNGDYYANELKVDPIVKEIMPDNISLTYWDYYHCEKEFYDKMFVAHKKMVKDVWFAGGAWSWIGFAPSNKFSMDSMIPAMKSVRDNKIKNVIITLWGDNGKDCSYNNLLPALHYIAQTAKGVTDEVAIKESFKKITTIEFDEFMALDLPGQTTVDQKEGYVGWQSVAKALLYSDPFLGRYDYEVKNGLVSDYARYTAEIEKNRKNRRYGYLFASMADLSKVLEIKYDLGVRTRTAYQAGDKVALEKLVKEDYTEVIKRLKKFYISFRAVWEKENKREGFEVQDMRLGGLMMRIENCQRVLKDYLAGKISNIAELEFEPLQMGDGDSRIREIRHTAVVSTSPLF